ncbi:MAG: TetR/AcrR family transcriptional regulator [Lachnospiraceae bacterium]|nr:TetR/AcrR family transcriptional regulator [Lachnospiraceae bacterium]
MPRKPQYTKEEIAEYSLKVVREQGIDSLTAREVAKQLGTTVAPIFVHYPTMEELKQDVRVLAQNVYQEYIRQGLTQKIPLLGVGMQYIRFARQESDLYRLLFLSDKISDVKENHYAMKAFGYTQSLVRDSLQRIYHIDALAADHYFRDLWLVAHGLATLIVTGGCTYTDAEINAIFTEISISICKAYKEIPGLTEGNYDRDAIFSELVNRE